MHSRLKKIRERLEDKCDALLIKSHSSSSGLPDRNFSYYSGVNEIASGVLYWCFESSPFVIISDYQYDSRVRKLKKESKEQAYEEIGKEGGKKIGYNADYVSVNSLEKWRKKLPDREWIDVSEELALARSVKEPGELKEMRKAAELAGKALELAEELIRDGKTELEVFREMNDFYYGEKAVPAFDSIVEAGESAQYIHYFPQSKKIRPKHTVIVDTGARWQGYCSDFTRTFCVKPGKKQKEMLELVGKANSYARDLAEPGMKAGQLYEKVKEFFGEKAEYWNYGLGHGVGLDIHEYPSLGEDSEHVLKENMVFTIEPGLAIPGVGGARVEHTGVLTKKGFKIL